MLPRVRWQASNVLVAQAGCILQHLDNHVAPHGALMPLVSSAMKRKCGTIHSKWDPFDWNQGGKALASPKKKDCAAMLFSKVTEEKVV